jgi:peptide/nickel transport system permease protein
MLLFILRRLGQGLITILILTVIVFGMSRLTGDPLNLLLPVDATQEQRDFLAKQLGLDRPLYEQFLVYLGGLLRGDLGNSLANNEPVLATFLERFPNTLSLIVPAFILAWCIGVPLAVVAATTRSAFLRQAINVLSTVGMAVPLFWLAIVLIIIFAVRLQVLPSSRMGGIDHYILPIICLTVFLLAGIVRLVRSSMQTSMGSEFIKLARIKGVSERGVIWGHALRNSLTAGLAFLGVYFSVLITGSIVIEKVFAWPGVGRLIYDGIVARDYPVVQGVILLSALLVVVVNLFFDILQAVIDPRIRL